MKIFALFLLLIVCVVSCSKSDLSFSQEEIKNWDHTEIKINSGQTCYLSSDSSQDGFIKKAIIYCNDGKIKVYFKVINKTIFDQNGKIILDGSKYGDDFFAWKIEILENGLYFHPFWKNGRSTTDPILYTFNTETQTFKKFQIDSNEY